jgi:hypothetical protein
MSGISAIAKDFVKRMALKGFVLNYSLNSLKTEIDKIIESTEKSSDGSAKMNMTDEIGLEAYIGETLLVLFSGMWQGEFNENTNAPNFYLSFIKFGDFSYFPSHFIGYRIANGPVEGTFKEHIQNVITIIDSALKSA